jgi:hypothetical protein
MVRSLASLGKEYLSGWKTGSRSPSTTKQILTCLGENELTAAL